MLIRYDVVYASSNRFRSHICLAKLRPISMARDLKAEFPQRKSRIFLFLLTYDLLKPSATWTFAEKQPNGSTLPQVIAHRGYKAAYPENSMAAFRGAVDVGVHGIETDVHATRDGVVVLSHVSTSSLFE